MTQEQMFTDANSYTSVSFGDQAAKARHYEELRAIRRLAATERKRVYTETFRMLAKERGGVNSRTREGIESEAKQAGQQAAEAVYLARGYTRCSDPFGFDCQHLASPGYAECPGCDVRF